MKPVRIQRKRTKGSRLPPNTVSVTRGTPFGNPFRVGEPCDRAQIRRWGWVFSCPEFVCDDAGTAVRRFRGCLLKDEAIHPYVRERLRGKNLACFCALDQPCHADVLLELANREDEQC